MSLLVIFAPQAVAQLEALAEAAGQYSTRARTNLLAAIAEKIQLIELQPEMYPVSALRPALRRCVITPTISLYYRLTPNAAEIVGVVDARRDPDALGLR